MLTTSLFIIANKWKQFKSPSVDEWINKMYFIHMKEYYSAIKGNDVLIHITTWMNFETTMLSERRHKN